MITFIFFSFLSHGTVFKGFDLEIFFKKKYVKKKYIFSDYLIKVTVIYSFIVEIIIDKKREISK